MKMLKFAQKEMGETGKRPPTAPEVRKRIKEFRALAEKTRSDMGKELSRTSFKLYNAQRQICIAHPMPDDAERTGLSYREPLSRNTSSRTEMHDNVEILAERFDLLEDLREEVENESGQILRSIPSDPAPKSMSAIRTFAGIVGVYAATLVGLQYTKLVQMGVATSGEAVADGITAGIIGYAAALAIGAVLVFSKMRSNARKAGEVLDRLEASLSELTTRASDAIGVCTEGVKEVLSGIKA